VSPAAWRLLVLGAGSAGAENLIRSLRRADPSLVLLGGNDDRFVVRRSAADARYVLPSPGGPRFVAALGRLIRSSRVDLVIPTIDRDVRALSAARAQLRGKVFLPAARVVELCHDKYRLTTALRRRGVPAPRTYPVRRPEEVDALFTRLGGPKRVWCRPRTGTCARGGAAVATPDDARRWMAVWHTMQGVPLSAFTVAEYLPGREILCQSVWHRGRMVVANTFERLAYFGADNIPSGVTSLSSLAKTVVEPRVVDVCRSAIAAVAPGASGAFSIDVKEDADGRPHVTEINAGRFFMAMTAFDRVLKHNIALTYVRLALGEQVELADEYDAVDEYYVVRDMDTEPAVFHADDFFDDVRDVSGAAQLTARPMRSARS
jgi:carbamoylphosphate synthase large subunit